MPLRPPFVEYCLSRFTVLEMGRPARFTELLSEPLFAKLCDPPDWVCDWARECELVTPKLLPTVRPFEMDLASADDEEPVDAGAAASPWNWSIGCRGR